MPGDARTEEAVYSTRRRGDAEKDAESIKEEVKT
jgi:hypothetical protein